ncbi:3-hydroxyacyl-CoA dehydrogenase [Sphingobium sp. 22B]|uniref:3-hydroxyacyl-CoA dehydrogenase NAD-binding domain-containing protein n=1 Tax=unclassified Sphingobium TaxID=2611147 RepID=UPI000782DC1F|nr:MULTISPECIES: 3-hydroxyacyl-CoA dehydrogenase NAD-binding domain-containing protein [unclassified Sphingobium]KXU31468.1 3-hydroxyacyl-CoA dehydrogenase [Sphingobium sp. AM]KYC31122.1 3-hydroxyacyl-CoA dehydrogenase [Sphingobium sp. 22B]OAP31124.1 3-hydroxyacyl-CoA dehydrogenase [Sphingobium sp. 20006FA]
MIETQRHGTVLTIRIGNPPVNALSEDVRRGIYQAIDAAQSDEGVSSIVIHGAGRMFSAGADITEFGKPLAEPGLAVVIDAIEASVKPVVAAIHGSALGGGLEVALGAHYRVATASAKLGLPEVALGLLPGAGGTQRLPRLVGIPAALDMIVSGSPISGAKALDIGLVDKIVPEASLVEDAIAYAVTLNAPRPTGARAVSFEGDEFDRFAEQNARKIQGLDAPQACIEAVRAATALPLAEGQEKERSLFHTLMDGAQSKALRHAFFAERAAAKIDGLPKDVALRSIEKVGVIGAGTMGGGISMNFLSAGIPVTIVEMAQEALERGTGLMRKNYEATAAKGRMTSAQVEGALGLLTPTLDFNALADCDLIIEAVYENMDVKKQIFARLDGIAKPGAILASNTSYLSVDEIAEATKRPQDVVGLHFFSPANIMKLVEVVRGDKTAPDVLATGMATARKIGKVPVVSGVCFGFIGNRMLDPRLEGAMEMLLEGTTPDQIDRVSVAFGMPMGPLQMIDLAGVDIGWHRDPTRIESLRDALNAVGRWGQKAGGGFYDYDEKRRPLPSPVATGIIDDYRGKAGVTPRAISDEEIMVRTMHVMVNEGAKILSEGIAQRASDIDVVWIYGYGWPRHTGGPMFWAEQVGFAKIVADLERYADRLGDDFSLSPLLVKAARDGRSLDEARAG